MFCKNCFRQVPDGARFCKYCGKLVDNSAQPEETQQRNGQPSARRRRRKAATASSFSPHYLLLKKPAQA
jgi:uncharacterized membrane protein YvbJ